MLKLLFINHIIFLELGIPFSDPIADGPIIQKAIERTLRNKISLIKTLNIVKAFRKNNKTTPIVLMGYMNPIEKIGYIKFSKMSKKVGVDGVLIVDLPPEESKNLNTKLRENNIDQIFLASPTTDNVRLKRIVKNRVVMFIMFP